MGRFALIAALMLTVAATMWLMPPGQLTLPGTSSTSAAARAGRDTPPDVESVAHSDSNAGPRTDANAGPRADPNAGADADAQRGLRDAAMHAERDDRGSRANPVGHRLALEQHDYGTLA